MRESKRSDAPLIRIVEPDRRYRQTVVALLLKEGWQVRSYTQKELLFDAEDMKRSGCIIVEARASRFDGLKLQTELIKKGIDLPIIFISDCDEVDMAVRAMKAGAVDYLLKPTAMERLVDVVRDATNQPTRDLEIVEFKRNLSTLSPREREVLEMMSCGYSNHDMAEVLGISNKTLEYFRSRIHFKLGIQVTARIIYLYLKVSKTSR